jgi:hypothetical protein
VEDLRVVTVPSAGFQVICMLFRRSSVNGTKVFQMAPKNSICSCSIYFLILSVKDSQSKFNAHTPVKQ